MAQDKSWNRLRNSSGKFQACMYNSVPMDMVQVSSYINSVASVQITYQDQLVSWSENFTI